MNSNPLATAAKYQDKVEKVMHEFKHGDLHASSGAKVHSPAQAIAIALSEQRRQDEGKS